MDPTDLLYLAFFALWLYGQIAAVRKKHQQRKKEKQQAAAARVSRTATEPTTVSTTAPSPAPPEEASRSRAEALVTSLRALEEEIATTLVGLDERVRGQVSNLVEHDFHVKARELRGELASASSRASDRLAQETGWLLSHYRGLLQTARAHSASRQKPDVREARAVADALADELAPLRTVASGRPPPVALVRDDTANDRLRESALGDSTLFVPRTVLQDPSHWSFLAPELARYLGASATRLYQDIYDGLELGIADARVGNDPRALTRVLFASWLERIVADVVGASFFGPPYLRSLTGLHAQPQAPARVTSIVINRDGSVHPEPPAHVRVHVTARWLARMGYASEASAIRRDWDERHGSPETLPFWGSTTSLPAAPVLEAASELTDSLFQLPLDALGKIRLAHVPGLSGWESHARDARTAKAALLSGQRASGSARAIVAGAIEAALETPEANTAINVALYDSLARVLPERPVPTLAHEARTLARGPVRASRGPFANLTGRDYAEAVILGEILLRDR